MDGRALAAGRLRPQVKSFYDERSGTATHVVYEAPGTPCAVIDPVFDLDPCSGRTSEAPLDRLAAFLESERLTVAWILETHVHHDHLSGAARLKERAGGRIGTGAGFVEVERAISRVYIRTRCLKVRTGTRSTRSWRTVKFSPSGVSSLPYSTRPGTLWIT